ncbi:hypothetical protein AWB73_02137 [Caballeronia turbans]|jgi:hypothetical protein|uniref:hypothetical protein n=1 Tax=Caballeronia sp. INML1 TaxID=2921760 RepID=UPI00074BD27B|nr:hypothetical protein [Caballeronia sp. INML1]SAL27574.1 hypothetical protein AWB73_02137 [Caballeronia turbans]
MSHESDTSGWSAMSERSRRRRRTLELSSTRFSSSPMETAAAVTLNARPPLAEPGPHAPRFVAQHSHLQPRGVGGRQAG